MIGVWGRRREGRPQGRQLSPSPKFGRKKVFFSGKHSVIFGQLIYFWKKEEQAPFIFDNILFFISRVRGI